MPVGVAARLYQGGWEYQCCIRLQESHGVTRLDFTIVQSPRDFPDLPTFRPFDPHLQLRCIPPLPTLT